MTRAILIVFFTAALLLPIAADTSAPGIQHLLDVTKPSRARLDPHSRARNRPMTKRALIWTRSGFMSMTKAAWMLRSLLE